MYKQVILQIKVVFQKHTFESLDQIETFAVNISGKGASDEEKYEGDWFVHFCRCCWRAECSKKEVLSYLYIHQWHFNVRLADVQRYASKRICADHLSYLNTNIYWSLLDDKDVVNRIVSKYIKTIKLKLNIN